MSEVARATVYPPPTHTHMVRPGGGSGSSVHSFPGSVGMHAQSMGRRPRGCRWPPAEQVGFAAGRWGCGGLGFQPRGGGAGVEAATNRGSTWTPHQPPITTCPAPPASRVLCSCWPGGRRGLWPYDFRQRARAMCTGVQGPLGGLLASQSHRPAPARGLVHSASSSRVALEGRDKALWEAGFGLR